MSKMTNIEKLKIKAAELEERGIKWNVSDYSALMGIEPESPEDKAGSILSCIESMDDPDAWTLRSFTDEDGIDGFEIKCKAKECDNQFKVLRTDKDYSRLTCPECGQDNYL